MLYKKWYRFIYICFICTHIYINYTYNLLLLPSGEIAAERQEEIYLRAHSNFDSRNYTIIHCIALPTHLWTTWGQGLVSGGANDLPSVVFERVLVNIERQPCLLKAQIWISQSTESAWWVFIYIHTYSANILVL